MFSRRFLPVFQSRLLLLPAAGFTTVPIPQAVPGSSPFGTTITATRLFSTKLAGPTYENIGQQRVDAEGSVLGLTENGALTYKSTGKACLNLCFDVLPHTDRATLVEMLGAAWEEDPLTTVKIIFQLGDPRMGKGDRKNLQQALLWLYENHFETLFLNLDNIGRFSYHKNLLELLVLALEGADTFDTRRTKWQYKTNSERLEIHTKHVVEFYESRPLFNINVENLNRHTNLEKLRTEFEEFGEVYDCYVPVDKISEEGHGCATIVMAPEDAEKAIQKLDGKELEGAILAVKKSYQDGFQKRPGRRGYWESDKLRQAFIEFIEKKNEEISMKAREARKDRESDRLRKAVEKYRVDEKYRRLYRSVAKYFARGLEYDRKVMEEGESNRFGGYAKWAPTLNGSHNRRSNICEGIIKELSSDRRRYHKLLSSIRRAAEIPESFTGPGEWNLVNYDVMPSLCRQLFGEMYRRHDKERYDSFLNQAAKQAERGEKITMMKAGVLLPHAITARASRSDGALNNELGLQWLRLVQDVKDKGKLPNALAICDVSGSMTGGKPQPLDVSVALSMIVSDVTSGPFRNQVITFSEDPELVQLPKPTTDNLASRVSFLKGIDWGYNTDFQAVFDLILGRAVAEKAAAEDMPSILFCFSDMEFDQAGNGGNWKTDLELIRSKYARAGYEVPTVVFWNLRDSGSKPASSDEPGVVMLSGFSAGILKAFLEFRLDDVKAPTPLESMVEMLRFYYDVVVAPGDMGMEDVSVSKQNDPDATNTGSLYEQLGW